MMPALEGGMMPSRKPRWVRWAVLAVGAVLFAGCAGTPAPVTLAPTPEFSKSDAGRGHAVALRVIDARKTTDIGSRDPAFGDRQPIESREDIAAVLRTQVAEGLQAHGFKTAAYADSAPRRLSVRLEAFAYESASAVVTSKVAVRSAIAVEATGPDQRFERRFAAERTDRTAFSPGAESREKAVNAALTDLIEQLFADPSLLAVLAGS